MSVANMLYVQEKGKSVRVCVLAKCNLVAGISRKRAATTRAITTEKKRTELV